MIALGGVEGRILNRERSVEVVGSPTAGMRGERSVKDGDRLGREVVVCHGSVL